MVKFNYAIHKETDVEALKISEGKFKGVVWNYKDVKFPMYQDDGTIIDPKEAEKIPLTFGYDILYNPTKVDLETGEFGAVIGDILLEIIDEGLEHDQIRFNTEDRTNDS